MGSGLGALRDKVLEGVACRHPPGNAHEKKRGSVYIQKVTWKTQFLVSVVLRVN